MNAIGWNDFGTQDTVSFILYGKMGDADSFQEVYGTYSNDFITFSDSICIPLYTETEVDDAGLITQEKTINKILIYPQPSINQAFISLTATQNSFKTRIDQSTEV